MKESITEESHKIFITAQDTVNDFFEEESPDDELSNEFMFPTISTIIKEEIDLETESGGSIVVKEEFSSGLQDEQLIDMKFSSDVNIPVKEESIIVEEAQNENFAALPASPVIESILKHSKDLKAVENYYCKLCKKDFTCLKEFTEHLKLTHSYFKKYKCDICSKAFTCSGTLVKHQVVHIGIKNYQCDICNKAFFRPSNLSLHKLIHSNVKNYKCDICNKAFTQPTSLSRHKLIHYGTKKYKCDICNKAFLRSSDMSKHKIMHSGIKKYQCNICDETFLWSGTLSKHKKIHNGIKNC